MSFDLLFIGFEYIFIYCTKYTVYVVYNVILYNISLIYVRYKILYIYHIKYIYI